MKTILTTKIRTYNGKTVETSETMTLDQLMDALNNEFGTKTNGSPWQKTDVWQYAYIGRIPVLYGGELIRRLYRKHKKRYVYLVKPEIDTFVKIEKK